MQKPEESESAVRKPAAIAVKKPRTVGLGTTILISVAVAAVAFIGGTRLDTIFLYFNNPQNVGAPENLDFSSVQEVYATMRQEFDGKIDAAKLIDGAKKGLVQAAGDPHTVYFTDDEAKQVSDDLAGKFSGIGAEIGTKDSNLIVVTTLDDSPARKAGLCHVRNTYLTNYQGCVILSA